jgi:hypothetical protein
MKRLLPVLVLALLLGGCAAAEPEAAASPTVTTPEAKTPSATPSRTPTPIPTPTLIGPPPTSTASAIVSSIPSPNPDQEAMLVAYLNEVDPALVGDDGIVNHARDECTSVLGGASEESLISTTKQRFETADFVPTDEQAGQILDAIRMTGWCVAG